MLEILKIEEQNRIWASFAGVWGLHNKYKFVNTLRVFANYWTNKNFL